MMNHLGLPIYYRIDKFKHFNDFDSKTIYEVTMKETEDRSSEYAGLISAKEIYDSVSSLISSHGENARTIKYKVQQVIENLLFLEIEDYFDD